MQKTILETVAEMYPLNTYHGETRKELMGIVAYAIKLKEEEMLKEIIKKIQE